MQKGCVRGGASVCKGVASVACPSNCSSHSRTDLACDMSDLLGVGGWVWVRVRVRVSWPAT